MSYVSAPESLVSATSLDTNTPRVVDELPIGHRDILHSTYPQISLAEGCAGKVNISQTGIKEINFTQIGIPKRNLTEISTEQVSKATAIATLKAALTSTPLTDILNGGFNITEPPRDGSSCFLNMGRDERRL